MTKLKGNCIIFSHQSVLSRNSSKMLCLDDFVNRTSLNEPPRGKTSNVVSGQVRHKPTCTSTEKS